MVEIPKHVQEFISGKLAWVATASRSGEPNVTPKGTLRILDGGHVLFADLFSNKTRKNLLENKAIAVTVVDVPTGQGFQLKGTAELLESGQAYDEACKRVEELGKGLPKPRYAVKIAIQAVFDQSAGAEPGCQIA